MEKASRMDKPKNIISDILDKSNGLIIHYLIIFITFVVYFYIRLFYVESIFFDFDMPRVALIVQDFLRSGTFLNSQSYMQESVWLNVPWGPALIYFYAFFINISPDPLVVANMLTLFHSIGIILIIKIGWKYFSPTVGVLSGILMATNPYWVTYSRIIYQPAPVITFIIISMYLLLSVIRDRSRLSTVLVPLSWAILIQIYIPTYLFIFISFLFLAYNYKNIYKKYFLVGIILASILFIPSVKFYFDNPLYLKRIAEAPSRFTPPEKTFTERLKKVSSSFVQIPVGGKFEWQTGYAFKDFVKYYPQAKVLGIVVSFVFTFILISNLLDIFRGRLNQSKLLVFLWTVCPFVSLLILWVTDLVPRYFLIGIPPAMLMISIFVNDMIIKYKDVSFSRHLLISVPLLISIYWTLFNINYDNFVNSYNYPNGRMLDIAETPYLHFKRAMNYAELISKRDGCNDYILSNDQNDINYSLWMETRYVWDYVYNNKYIDTNDQNNNCIYLLTYEYVPKELGINEYKMFGPFAVFKKN